jgi:hypothetical protein
VTLTGRCLCGAVRIRLVPPTDFVAHCHCSSCRLAHGAPLVTWTSVPKDRFAFDSGEEKVTWYRSSDHVEWGFCSACGTSLLYRAIAAGHPESPKLDRMYVTAASLTSLDREPAAHVSFEEKVPWLDLNDPVAKYRGKGVEKMS